MNSETALLNEIDVDHIEDVKPTGDNVLIYPIPLNKERQLESGIIIPDTQLEFHDKPRWGVVIAVGPKVKDDLRPGDKVLIREGTGVIMSFQDDYDNGEIKEYLFVKADGTGDHLYCTFDRET